MRRNGVFSLETASSRYKARKAGLDVPLQFSSGVVWSCAGGCGKTERRPPSKAVHLRCAPCRFAAIKGSGNPNYRNAAEKTCFLCGEKFSSYNRDSLFCSRKCYQAKARLDMRYGAKRDANHSEIVAALQEYGVSVIDTSHIGRGFPDLMLGWYGQTLMMEIKNPKTQYGRRGLNKNQMRWKEDWKGGPYAVVSTVDGAMAAVVALEMGSSTVATVTDVDGALRVLASMESK